MITNFDIRLVQPNENAIPTAGLHTIEHLLAKLIRERIDGMIDCSPFGCRTGFHLIMWGKHNTTEIAKVIKSSLEEIATVTSWDDVPGTTIESCGNYKDHSLFTAKEWVKLILKDGISDDPLNVTLSKTFKSAICWLFYTKKDREMIFPVFFDL